MLYVTGDTHGRQDQWVQQVEPVLQPGDTMIVCGDFGVGFWKGRFGPEEAFYDHISGQDYTVLFVDGNHENFEKLYSYPEEEWKGGRVHKIRHNLLHLMRGEVYSLDGITLFAFGGGYSLDKYIRQEDVSWWRQEMPSPEEYENARANLRQAGQQAGYIITHTAPSESVCYLSTIRRLGIKNNVIEEMPLTTFLDDIYQNVAYKHWYIGHFHVDVELWRNQTAMLSTIRRLETGEIVRQWETCEGRS